MKRYQMILARAVILALFLLSVAIPTSADGKNATKAVKDVKFSCSQHGPTSMNLTLSAEAGTARKVEIIGGNSGAKWFVKIDNNDVAVANGATVKVRSGDTITWKVAAAKHGVVFAEQDLAQAMIDFDTTVGKPLIDQTTNLNTTAWKTFGTKRWGTDPTVDVGVLASGKVK